MTKKNKFNYKNKKENQIILIKAIIHKERKES